MTFSALPIVKVTRRSARFDTLEELDAEWGELTRRVEGLDRGRFGLYLDVRQVAGRNDPQFEERMIGHRRRVFTGFAAVALLAATEVGKLQLERHLVADGVTGAVFLTDARAMAYLRSRLDKPLP